MRKFLLSFATLFIAMLATVQLASATTLIDENFNSLTSGIPAGWDNADGTTSYSSYRWTYDPSGHTGACVKFNSYWNTSGNTNMLKTPAMDMSAAGSTWVLSFWYKNPAGGDFSVYVSTDGGTSYTTAVASGLTGVTDWTYYEVSLTSVASGHSNVKIVFQGTSNYGYGTGDAYIYLDDVKVESAPACKNPKDLLISGLTTTSATLTWALAVDGDIPSVYDYKLKNESGNIIAQNSSLSAPAMTYTITGLTANTTYTVELAGNCNSTYSGLSDTKTITFTTLCNAQNAPYTQDFNSLIDLPECTFSSCASLNASGRTGQCLAFATTAASDAHIVFPELNLSSNNVEATFFIKAAAADESEVYQVGICTDPSDVGSSFEMLASGVLSNTQWTEVRMNTALTTQPLTSTTKICVILPQKSNTYYIDDVSIHAIPSCVRPENFALSNVTSTSVDFAWNTTTATQCRIYAYTATDTTAYMVSTNPATLTGLTPNTNYSFQIRGICSATDSSEINPYILQARTECVLADSALFNETFDNIPSGNTTPDCWHQGWIVKPSGNTKANPFATTTVRAHSGTTAMSLVDQTAGSISYLSSQQLPFDQSGHYTLSVWVYRQNASSYPAEGLKFWVNTVPDDTTGGTLLGFVPRNYSTAPAESSYNDWFNYEYVVNRTGNLYVIVEGISQYGSATYFDDVQVKVTPSCMKVTNIATGNITPTDATITWNAGASESQWAVRYVLTQGANVIDTVVDTVSTPSITISNLTSATVYNVAGSVTSICSATDHSEAVSFSLSIVTACQALTTLPYSTGFEASELTSISHPLPYCWTRYNDASGSYNYYPYANTSATYARNGSGSLYFYESVYSDYGNNQVAILPELDTTAHPLNTLRMVVNARTGSSSYSGMMYAGVMSNPTDISTFVAVDSFTVSGTDYTKYDIHFNNYAGNGTYMALLVKKGTSSCSYYVDDVQISLIPTCGDLSGAGVSATDVTDVTAKFTCLDATATNWSYAYGTAGTPASQCIAVDVNGQTNVTVTGLTAQTDYVVYARRNCGNEYGAWSDAVAFRTACGAQSTPVTEDFESMATGVITGTCYNVANSNSYLLSVFSGSDYNTTTGGTKGVSSGSSYGYNYSTSGTHSITAFVHLDASKSYEIAVHAKDATSYYTEYGYDLSFVLGTGTNNLTTLSTELITNTTFERFNTYFTVPTTGDYYVGVQTAPNAAYYAYYYPYIDDISIEEVACIPPTATMVNALTSDSVNIGFTSNSTQWEVAVSASPIDITGIVVGEVYHDTISVKSFSVSGLSVNTEYYYTIRTLCTQGGTSAWMKPQSFRTRCVSFNLPVSEGFEATGSTLCWNAMSGSVTRSTTQHNSGSASMLVSAGTATTPELNVITLAPDMITGWAYSTSSSASFDVGVMTDPQTFISVRTVTLPASTWTEFTVPFDTLTDPDYSENYNDRYIAFATTNIDVYFDDIMIDVVPTCPKPGNGTITGITAHQATLNWTENGNATSWQLRIVPATGAAIRQAVNARPYTVTGLNAATTYDVYVASICSATDTSYEYKVGSFTTDCDYVNAPWSETFDRMTADAVPLCWDNSASSTTTLSSNPERIWGVWNASGNNSIRMYNYYVRAGSALINTPEVILAAGGNYQLRYDYANQSSVSMTVKIRRHGDAQFTDLATHNGNGSTDYSTPASFTTNSVDISTYAGDTVQIQFYSDADYGSGAIFVDNVKVRLLSSCVEPVSVATVSVNDNSATLVVNDTVAQHNAWQYVVGTTGFDPDAATPVSVTADTFQVSNLSASTNYDLYVRAVCGANDYSSWVQISFKTTAVPAALPYVCDFTNTAENATWEFTNATGANTFMIGTDANAAFETGGSALYVSNNGSYTYDPYTTSVGAAYRVFTFGSNTYNIEFDWKCSGGQASNDIARFYLLPAGRNVMPTYSGSYYISYNWPSGLIALDGGQGQSLVYGDQHVNTTLNMTGREGTYNLVFVWVNNNYTGTVNYPFSASNISVRELTCMPLSGLQVISDSVGETSIAATCTNPNAGSTLRWAVSTSNMISDTIMSGTTTADTFSITGLTCSTVYHLFVRSECSASDCLPWATAEFQTACGTISTFPFTEGFENPRFPPTCWTNTTLTSGEDWYGDPIDGTWSRGTYTYYQYGNGNAWADMTSASGASALLATPAFHFEAGREYHVSFTMYRTANSYYTYDDQLKVYVGPNAASKIGATLIKTVISGDDDITTGIFNYDVDIPATMVGDYHILFEGIYNSTGNIHVDDITVDRYPLCRKPSAAPTVDATTATTVTVSSPMLSNQSSIEFGFAPFSAQATPAAITQTATTTTGTATVTGLTAATSYSVFARAICTSCNDTSEWTAASKATTKADDCFEPDNLRIVGSVSDTAVTIAWNTVPNVTSYQCVFTTGTSADTIVTTATQASKTDLVPRTSYSFAVRGFCGATDTTGWSTLTFKTISHPAELPYTTGFELTDDNTDWIRVNSAEDNNFVFGTDNNGRYTGSQGLYISSNGSTYSQSLPGSGSSSYSTSYNVTFATRTIHFPAAGSYQIAYDWKCDPVSSASYYPYYEAGGRSFLAPANSALTADQSTYISTSKVPTGGIALTTSYMTGSQTWQHSSFIVTIPDSGYMDMVFMWYAENLYGSGDDSDLSDYPLAIDNFSASEVSCLPVNAISTVSVCDTAITVAVDKPNAVNIDYVILTVNSTDSISAYSTMTSAALADTLSFGGLTANTQYYVFVREVCDATHRSGWTVHAVKTTVVPAALPYVCDFENSVENAQWQTASGTTNPFIVGTATSNGGTHSIYISDDGASYNYDMNTTSYSYAYRTFYLSEGLYEYSFDWKANGETSYDYGHMFLIPADVVINGGSSMSGLSYSHIPANAIQLDRGAMHSSNTYTTVNDTFSVGTAKSYNMVIYWTNDYGYGTEPPLSIDNISLSRMTCSLPSGSVDTATVTETSARAVVRNNAVGSQLVWAVSTTGNITDAVLIDTIPYHTTADTLYLTNLSPSSNYQLMLRSLCDSDVSMWVRVPFKTDCGVITTFPYYEGFESLSTTYTENLINDICWNSLGESSIYPYYKAALTSNYSAAVGNQSLQMLCSSSIALYLTLPNMGDLNSLQLAFQYKNQYVSAYGGIVSAGYMTNPNVESTFVELYQGARTTSWTPVTLSFSNVPAGARIAFKYSAGTYSGYYGFLDDIRVSQLAEGPTFNDTVCYNKPYTLHGFNIAANQMTVGNNTFTRIETATEAGEMDTIYTANVYMRADITSTAYDTTCAGQPYTVGRWNIQHPMSRRYYTTFTGAAACGCDSTVELFLTVVPTSHETYDTICQGDSYNFYGTVITTPGRYSHVAVNQYGCNDTTFLNMFVADTATITNATICQGESYYFGGQARTQAGTYHYTTTGAAGCPLTETLVLTVLSTDTTIYASICQGGFIQVVDTVIRTAGNFTIVRLNSQGCNVTYHINTVVVTAVPTEIYDDACQGHPYSGYSIIGLTVTQDTVVTITGKTIDGQCDSITNVNLHYIATVYGSESVTIKEGQSYTWNNQTYNTAGDYTATLQSVVTGCDSIATLHLYVSGTGVDNVDAVTLQIVPNPVTTGATALVYGNFGEARKVEILNNFGQVVDQFEPQSYPIEVSGINAAGLYYVRITTADGNVHVQKLIVK